MSSRIDFVPDIKKERWKYTNLTKAVQNIPEELCESNFVIKDPNKLAVRLEANIGSNEKWLSELISRKPVAEERYKDMGLWDLSNHHLRDGVLIDAPANKKCQIPIELIFKGSEKQFFVPRTIIRLQEGSELTLIEQHNGTGDYWNNHLTQIVIEKNAKLTHLILQENSASSVLTKNTHIEIEEKGEYKSLNYTAGALLSRNQIHVDLLGFKSTCKLHGINLLSEKQLGDTTIEVAHKASHCNSEQTYKTVLDDQARGVFQGKVFVHSGAHQTEAHQLSNALILNEGAEMDTKPELEIYDEDVKCSHGATIGQLDENALFYLRSRGLPEKESREMLIKAFISEIVEEYDNEIIKNLVYERL
jgi:Fe-S cluster assembly protein SufD